MPGLAGAAGVALAAAGAHGDGYVGADAAGVLPHHACGGGGGGRRRRRRAPRIRAASCSPRSSCWSASRCSRGDIAARTLWGMRLFPMAAPIGGSTMIIGWLVLSAAGIWEVFAPARLDRRRANKGIAMMGLSGRWSA